MSRVTRTPHIPAPPGDVSPGLNRFLTSVKELAEVGAGRRGHPDDRYVKVRDLPSGLFSEDGVLHLDVLALDELIVGDTITIKDGSIAIEKLDFGSDIVLDGDSITRLADRVLDNIGDGSTYARVLATDISAGHIKLSEVIGDLDDVTDGSIWGRVRLTYLDAGKITLVKAEGDLDDIADGAGYHKVSATYLDGSGRIVLIRDAGTNLDIDHFIAEGAIDPATGKHKFSEIYDDGGSLTLASSKLVIDTTDGIDVLNSGSITLRAGGDIRMESASGNPSSMTFKGAGGYAMRLGFNYDANALAIFPSDTYACDLMIGETSGGATDRVHKFFVFADWAIALDSNKSISLNAVDYITLDAPFLRGWNTPDIGSVSYKFGSLFLAGDIGDSSNGIGSIYCGTIYAKTDNLYNIGSTTNRIASIYAATRIRMYGATEYVDILDAASTGGDYGYGWVKFSVGGAIRYAHLKN